MLKRRRVSGIETLIVRDPVRGSLSVRLDWTDWAAPSTNVEAHYFAYEPLLELIGLVKELSARELDV